MWPRSCSYLRKVLVNLTGPRLERYLSSHEITSPLTGIRILDLTRILAGPYCTMILGDLGAEVIKVEAPGGDDTRGWGPPFKGPESCYFLAVNRNKKSICINLKTPDGVDILKKLAIQSDVLVENFVPGKLDSLGIGYEEMKKVAPHLVYCSITGYGSTGPSRHKPGYDLAAASAGGLMHITGPENGEPCKVGVALTDLTTGLYAHGAIMAAILHRQRSGKGQKIDCSLLASQIATLANIGSNYLNAGQEGKRWGTAHESLVPYESFHTEDGYILIGAGNEKQFQDLCKRMGLQTLVEDARFQSNALRVVNRAPLVKTLSERLKENTTDEWLRIFSGAQFPCSPVNTIAQAFADPQVVHNQMVVEMEHPTSGTVKVVGPAVKYEDGGNFCRSPPPTLGQHTNEILNRILGLTDPQISILKSKNAIS